MGAAAQEADPNFRRAVEGEPLEVGFDAVERAPADPGRGRVAREAVREYHRFPEELEDAHRLLRFVAIEWDRDAKSGFERSAHEGAQLEPRRPQLSELARGAAPLGE